MNKCNLITLKISEKSNKIISEFLKQSCFSVKHKGSLYLKYAFHILNMDETSALNLKKNVYMEISEHFVTGSDSVERDIAFAIKKAFLKSKKENIENCFSDLDTAPTNSEFIKSVYSFLK